MKRTRHLEGKAALELVEEAVHVLRAAPAFCLVAYYLGSVPFLVGLLFFWADMSRSAFAAYHTVEAALGMALLFLWMKTWQAIFARRLRVVLSGHESKSLGAADIARIAVSQAAVHSVGLFVVPLSLIAMIPFGWVFAFCQSATALADDGLAGLPRYSARLLRHSALWPYQNHALLLVLFGFGMVVFLNWTSVCLALPFLAKTLFGIESIYSRSVFSLLNTTFFAAMFGLTYLAVDPLVKAVYLLRCFYGDSLKSGEDVRGELKQVAVLAGGDGEHSSRRALQDGRIKVVAMLAVVAAAQLQIGFAREFESRVDSPEPRLIYTPLQRGVRLVQMPKNRFNGFPGTRETVETVSEAMADKLTPLKRGVNVSLEPTLSDFQSAFAAAATAAQGVSESAPSLAGDGEHSSRRALQVAGGVPPEELDKAIQETIKKRKYAWRMPRDKAPEKPEEQSMLSRFFEKVGDMIQRALKAVGRWLDNFLRGLFQGRTMTKTGSSGYNWVATLQMLAYFLIAVVVGAAIWLLLRYWRGGRLGLQGVASTPIEPAPDLADESVGADQLPEDGWIRLGRDLLERGDFRLALRAFYLASLAHVAGRNLVSLARFKSNRDYQRELQRRAHAFPEVSVLFGDIVRVFDRVWYGMHTVDAEVVKQFVAHVERLKEVGA